MRTSFGTNSLFARFWFPLLRLLSLLPPAAQLNEFGWTADGARFFSTTGLGTVEVMAYPSMEVVREIQGHTSSVYALAFDPQERYHTLSRGAN